MKIFKRIIVTLLIIIALLPFVLYAGIFIANNIIADNVEKDLVAYQLPASTKLVDSISIAGKLTGNGNGMQYMGSILVETNLSEQELKEHYGLKDKYVQIRKQDTAKIDFLNSGAYSFSGFVEDKKESYYSITCWADKRAKYGELVSELLDFDIRGH